MTETMNMVLKAAPGVLTAVWTPASGQAAVDDAGGAGTAGSPQASPEFRQVLKMEVWPLSRRQEAIKRLAGSPGELYGLLKGRLPAWLAEFGLWPDESELAVPDTNDEAANKEAIAKVRERLAKEPLTALALRGLPKGELTDEIFALWARGTGGEAGTGLSAELGRLEKKGPAVSAGEWLAEASAEGSLHQPGPAFLEVRDRSVPDSPSIAPSMEDWKALLPNVPRAQEGLELIMRRAAEAAARRAAKLVK